MYLRRTFFKRIPVLCFSCFCAGALLLGCQNQGRVETAPAIKAGQDSGMVLEPAGSLEDVSQETDQQMRNRRTYEFSTNSRMKTLRLCTYQLQAGAWKTMHCSDFPLTGKETEGSLSLQFGYIPSHFSVSLTLDGQTQSSTISSGQENLIPEGMGIVTTMKSDSLPICYDTELPLVCQIATTKEQVNAYPADSYFTPEDFSKEGYEHVYIVTAAFSEKTIQELDNIKINEEQLKKDGS